LLLQNGDDPIPKFAADLLWRRPDWLGPDRERPPGAPMGTRWLPITTFLATFVDMQNALAPTPGLFDEGGHDYRREIPEAVRVVFGLQATDQQFARVEDALRRRELRWEAARQWDTAEEMPTPERASAEKAVEAKLSSWVGHDVDVTELTKIISGDA
jgi:Alpha/beta-hydrolase family